MQEKQLVIEAKFFKGLADKSRLAILETIMDGEKTVGDIVTGTQLSQPNVSMHLACLLECGLVKKDRDGRQVKYSLAAEEVKELLDLSRKLVSRNAEEIYNCTNY